jgi:hypothetical protein
MWGKGKFEFVEETKNAKHAYCPENYSWGKERDSGKRKSLRILSFSRRRKIIYEMIITQCEFQSKM